jgi:hypothetical protein
MFDPQGPKEDSHEGRQALVRAAQCAEAAAARQVGGADVSASGRIFVLRPVTSTDRTTGVVSPTNLVEPPEELEAAWIFLRIANAYKSQANQLLDLIGAQLKTQTVEYGLPVRHLYCHAIELYLKAWLLADGMPKTKLRNQRTYGHRLQKLYTECKSRRLVMASSEEAYFDRMLPQLRQGHEEYQFRYLEKTVSTADPDLIRAAAHAIAPVAWAHFENLKREAREQAEKEGKQFVLLPKRMFVSAGAGTTPDGKVPVTVGFIPPLGDMR